MTMIIDKDKVDDLFLSEKGDLKKFIKFLHTEPPKQRVNKKVVIPAQTAIIATFEVVAEVYLMKGKELLKGKSAQLRFQQYELLLGKVQRHALQLSELARPVPNKPFFPTIRRDLLENVLKVASQRLPGQPIILLMLGDYYKYLHFNYINGFGAICVPPRTATENASNQYLGVLWHEAAGYAIAEAKLKDKDKDKDEDEQGFERWAKILHDHLVSVLYELENTTCWQLYSELFQKSLLINLGGRQKYKLEGILTEIEDLIRKKIFKKYPNTVDGEGSWQVVWLSEFLEDLYWVMVGKVDGVPSEMSNGVLNVMAGALAATYEDLRVGDFGHPPPFLRMLVAICFLCDNDQALITQVVATFVGEGDNIFGLNTNGADIELAKAITKVCQDILNEQESNLWLYGTKVSEPEKNLASDIVNQRPLQFGSPLDSIQVDNSKATENFIKRINAAETLDELLAIDFTSDDLHPFGGGSSMPPPLPWYRGRIGGR